MTEPGRARSSPCCQPALVRRASGDARRAARSARGGARYRARGGAGGGAGRRGARPGVRALDGFAAWRPLAEVTDLWKREPRRAAVVLAAALAAPPGLADPSAARAYDQLYRAFLGDGARDAWDLLAPALPGKPDDWDRCRRLAQGLADAVLGRHGAPRPGVLSAVPTGRRATVSRSRLSGGRAGLRTTRTAAVAGRAAGTRSCGSYVPGSRPPGRSAPGTTSRVKPYE